MKPTLKHEEFRSRESGDGSGDRCYCTRCANELSESQIGLCDSCQDDDSPKPDADQIKNICGQILAGYAQGKSGLDDDMIDLLIELGDLSSDIITLLNERTR